jgi:hypothetical protein
MCEELVYSLRKTLYARAEMDESSIAGITFGL